METFLVNQSSQQKSCNINDVFRTFSVSLFSESRFLYTDYRAPQINVVGTLLLGDCSNLADYQDTKPELLKTVDGLSRMIPLRE